MSQKIEGATPEQQKEFDALLAKLETQLKEANMHPVVRDALFLLQDGDARWWPEGMPAENVEKLREALEAIPKQHLKFAVYDLCQIAVTVGQSPGGKMAGGHLLHFCNQVIEEKNLIGAAKGDAEFDPGALAKAKGAIAAAPRAQPGKVGEKAPEGSLRIDQLPGRKPRI
jgi:hypothetical protein